MAQPPDILQVSSADIAGGAERVAWDLFRAYRELGGGSWLAVGRKKSTDPDVFAISGGHVASATDLRGSAKARFVARALRNPAVLVDHFRGFEQMRFPASHRILELPPRRPEVLHCHNLHGGFFDLRALPELSRRVPLVVTLHDAWLLSGHCAHSFACDRWLTGCGSCPDLTIYPALRHDGTATNWMRKRAIFQRTRLSLVAPCRWLLGRAERSLIAPAIIDTRVIPYGIDLETFAPGDRAEARRALSLPIDAAVLLFAANGIRKSPWRDYGGLRTALEALQLGEMRIICLALGDKGDTEQLGNAEVRFVPFVNDPADVARHYHAADVYVHPSIVDTFPNSVLQALACGLPVVATRVGGIPEQVDEELTGLLVPPRDPPSLRAALERVLVDDELRQRLGRRSAEEAKRRFSLTREIDDHLDLFASARDAFDRAARGG